MIINTRPIERGKALSDSLRQAGLHVFDLPLLEMFAKPLSDCEQNQLNQLVCSNDKSYDVLVAVSPTAVQLAIQYLYKVSTILNLSVNDLTNNLTQFSIVAVGMATARELRKFGISAIVPKQASNEGMLELDSLRHLHQNNRVMIWRGKGGRRLLIDSLRERQVQVDVIEFYERRLPENSKKLYKNLCINHYHNVNLSFKKTSQPLNLLNCHRKIPQKNLEYIPLTNLKATQSPWVIISSGESFHHWQHVIDRHHQGNDGVNCEQIHTQLNQLNQYRYLVLGERLEAILERRKLAYQRIEDLSANSVLSAIGRYGVNRYES